MGIKNKKNRSVQELLAMYGRMVSAEGYAMRQYWESDFGRYMRRTARTGAVRVACSILIGEQDRNIYDAIDAIESGYLVASRFRNHG